MAGKRTIILTHYQIERKIVRMAWEIFENNHLAKQLILLGIGENGNHIANEIAKILLDISKIKIETGRIDLNKVSGFESEILLNCPTELDDKTVILIDDVMNSGKTMLAAMQPILTKKPAKIQTAVLANRNHKSFPVKADIVGISMATTLQEHIWFAMEPHNKMVVFLT